jgi:hypothetical protein
MSQSLLNKVWSFLTVLLLYLCLNVWSITQQWQLSFPGNPFKVESVTANGGTVYGVPLCGALLVLVAVETRIYAVRARKKHPHPWQERLPHFGDFNLDSAMGDAKAFQLIMLVALLLVPAAGIVHFELTFMSGTVRELLPDCAVPPRVCCKIEPTTPCACFQQFSGWSAMLFHDHEAQKGAAWKYDPDPAKKAAPDFIQFWQPWSYLVISAAALGNLVWSLLAVFKWKAPPAPKKAHHHK